MYPFSWAFFSSSKASVQFRLRFTFCKASLAYWYIASGTCCLANVLYITRASTVFPEVKNCFAFCSCAAIVALGDSELFEAEFLLFHSLTVIKSCLRSQPFSVCPFEFVVSEYRKPFFSL